MSGNLLNIVEQIMSSVSKLADLLNDDKEYAEEAIERFKDMLEEHIDEVGEDAFCESFHEGFLGYSLASFIDEAQIGNSFSVDWKDTESALDWLGDALELEGIKIDIDYSVDDPVNELDARQIFVRSNQQLQSLGYSLLGFDTGDDSYREILLPSDSVDQFIQIALEINVEMDLNDTEEE